MFPMSNPCIFRARSSTSISSMVDLTGGTGGVEKATHLSVLPFKRLFSPLLHLSPMELEP
jgi:hypothetical protein